jgi:hypothetical protein
MGSLSPSSVHWLLEWSGRALELDAKIEDKVSILSLSLLEWGYSGWASIVIQLFS